MKKVLILGGGFGGIYTAMNLAKVSRPYDGLEVSIVNRENYMVFQPMMPEVISGSIDLIHCISPIRRLCPHADLINRSVEKIDLEARVVRISPGFGANPLRLEYDYLVLALGTVYDFSSSPGVKEHGLPFKNMAETLVLRNQIIHVREDATVEKDPVLQQALLIFAVAGGDFSGGRGCRN